MFAILMAATCIGGSIEVPAIITIPEASPEQIQNIPTLPIWEGENRTIGVLGEDKVDEETVRSTGFTIVFGTAGDSFREPIGMGGKGSSLHDNHGTFLTIKSSLSGEIHKSSYGKYLQLENPQFKATRDNIDCPNDSYCRLSLSFPAIEGYSVNRGDEKLKIIWGERIFESGFVSKTDILSITIIDDSVVPKLQQSVADMMEVAVVGSVLFGSSLPAAMSASRHLLLLHLQCGIEHDALDHATNPAEMSIGNGKNRFYLGGLISNLLISFLPIFIHLFLVLLQWKCKGLTQEAEVTERKPITDFEEKQQCFGITITEFRQLQATVRYPHYSLLFLLFAFQGIATCGWRLLIHGTSASEHIVGFAALFFFNACGILFVWWKLGKGSIGRLAAVFITIPNQSKMREYFLGNGEWVSSTRRRLVHTYAVIFECYNKNNPRFLLLELCAILMLALLGTLDASDWGSCIGEFAAATLLSLVFLLWCLWVRPWSSRFDNHSICFISATESLSLLISCISLSMKGTADTAHLMSEWLLLLGSMLIMVKAVIDIICLIFDTCSGRRWQLQEAFEQGQTMYSAREFYFSSLPVKTRAADPKDEEGTQLLSAVAPSASSVFQNHVLSHVAVKAASTAPLEDCFEHQPTCPISTGLLLLSKRGALRPECPACWCKAAGTDVGNMNDVDVDDDNENGGGGEADIEAPQPPPQEGNVVLRSVSASTTASREISHFGSNAQRRSSQASKSSKGFKQHAKSSLSDWSEFFTEDGDPYYYNRVTNQTTWNPHSEVLDHFSGRYTP
eukprot:TRINITY_DN5305_c0_g4_i4.p1 TRINITY_DN5305_c0_g4~~TRINITY_DN5305_c0_g4_i4.p1  ORF type:complete len:789 (+),score=107.98 TRINITY_DN5305_c0_g4_i4:54-2420(+)